MKGYLFIFLLIMGFGLSSCDSNKDLYASSQTSHTQRICDKEDSSIPAEECYKYVLSNPELFGEKVMFFESPNQLYNELDTLNSMDYENLREWQRSHAFYNPIISSIIIHDSVWISACSSCGYDIKYITNYCNMLSEEESIEYIKKFEKEEDLAFEKYAEIISTRYKDLEKIIINDDGTTTYAPLGSLDESAMLNEKGILICGDIVIKQLEGGWFACHIYEFKSLSAATTIEQVENIITSSVNKHPIHLIKNSNNRLTTYSIKDNHYNENPDYRMTVNFRLSAVSHFFNFRRVYLQIINEHKNKQGQYHSVSCWTKLNASVIVGCPFTDDWTAQYNLCWAFRGKTEHARWQLIRCNCPYNEIREIYVKAKNQHGVIIDNTI